MDLWGGSTGSRLVILLLSIVLSIVNCKVINSGYLNAGKEVTLTFDNTNPDDCLEYYFMTNYKKVYFNLVTTPSSVVKYKQRIILSDMPFSKCPQKCTEEPNYCTAISNRVFSQTQATFSKWFPTLYIYVINQIPTTTNLVDFLDSVKDLESVNDSNLEIVSSLHNLNQNQDVNALEETTDSPPLFTLTPSHLDQGCRLITKNLVPKCASLAKDDCVNPAFCTEECSLLTCQSDSGEKLFSLCTASNYTEDQLTKICESHAEFGKNYTWTKCENPIPYPDSLSETAVSIFLLSWVTMGLFVVCVCCYNLRLLKSGEVPWDVCPFCPEWLFPREIEDNPLYKDNDKESHENFMF